MNIYADRGNLLLLERRCAWRGHRLRASRRSGLGDDRPRGPRPLLPRRRPGPRPAPVRAATSSSTSATRCTPPRTPARVLLAVCGGYPAARPRLRARRRGDPRARARRPAHGARGRPPADRQRRDRGGAPGARRPARPGGLREPRRAHAPRRGRAARSAGSCAATATPAPRARRACAAAASSGRTCTARCCPRTPGSPTGSSPPRRASGRFRRSTTRSRTPPTHRPDAQRASDPRPAVRILPPRPRSGGPPP